MYNTAIFEEKNEFLTFLCDRVKQKVPVAKKLWSKNNNLKTNFHLHLKIQHF